MRSPTLRGPLPALLAAFAALAAPHALAQTPSPGWTLATAPSFGGSLLELSDGTFVRWDGSTLARLDGSGAVLTTYATFAPSVFTGVLELAPDESFAIVGESSNGVVYRLDLPAGPLTPLATIDFNYDAAFAPNGDLVISAATTSFASNDLIRLDPASGATTPLGSVPGPSGPIAFAPNGDLWYATQAGTLPPPPGATDILFWQASQVAAGGLSISNAIFWRTGLDGASSLAVDPETSFVYVAETSFSPGYVGTIQRVLPSPLPTIVLFSGPTDGFVGFSQLRLGAAVGVFGAYQPNGAGRLRISWNDFAGNAGVRYLEPLRPVASFSGRGTTGPGDVVFELAAGAPSGFGVLLLGPASLVPGTEASIYGLVDVPLLLGLDAATLTLLPPLALDANGALALPFMNPGGLEGLIAAQVLVLDAAFQPVGTSNVATF